MIRGIIGSKGITPAGTAHVEVGQTYMHRHSCEYRMVRSLDAKTVAFTDGAPIQRWIFEALVASGDYIHTPGLRPYHVTMVEADGAPGMATLTYWEPSEEAAVVTANRAWAGVRVATTAVLVRG